MDFEKVIEKLAMGNSPTAWMIALGAFVVTFYGLRIGLRLAHKRLSRLAVTTENRVDDLFADLLGRTKWFFIAAIALAIASKALRLPSQVVVYVGYALTLAFGLQAGVWGDSLVKSLIALRVDIGPDGKPTRTALGTVLRVIGRVVVWALVTLLILQNLGVKVTALLAGLGIGGIAVALAVQNVLGDLLASLAIAVDKPFRPGDTILLDNIQGKVEAIGLKSTRIRSLNGEEIVLSNSELVKARIHNFASLKERRVLFSFGVTYDTSAEKLELIPVIVREVIESVPQTRFDRAHFKSYGDYALIFEVVYYVLDADYRRFMDIHHAVNLGIYKRFSAEGIAFAYPTQNVILSSKD